MSMTLLSWIFRGALIGLMVVDGYFAVSNIPTRFILFSAAAFAPLAITNLLTPAIQASVPAVLFIGFIGNTFNLYDRLPWYDDLLHFLAPVVIAFTISHVLTQVLDKKTHPILTFLLVVLSTVGVAGLWEVYEWLSYLVFDETLAVVSVADTISDITLAFLGSLAVAIWITRRKRWITLK